MDDALFLQAARVGGEAHKRVGDVTMTVHTADWLRPADRPRHFDQRLYAISASCLQPTPLARR